MIVQSQSAKKAILAALADEEMTKILDSIMYHSKSIVDITRENNIPHTTCYRKTKWLLNEGLVIVDKIIITPEGKKFSLYHSVLKSINPITRLGSLRKIVISRGSELFLPIWRS